MAQTKLQHSFFSVLESHKVPADSKIFNMTSMIGGKYYISQKHMERFYSAYEKFILSKSSAKQHTYLQEVLPKGISKFFIDIDCKTIEESESLLEKCKYVILDLMNIEAVDLELLELSNTVFPSKKHVFMLYRGLNILVDNGTLEYLTHLIGSDKTKGLRLPYSLKKEGIEKGKYIFNTTSKYNKMFYYSLLYHKQTYTYKPTYKIKLFEGWAEYYNTIVNKPVQETEKKHQTIFEKGEDVDEKIEWILERILQNNYSALEDYGSWWNIVQACKNLNFDVDKLAEFCGKVGGYEDDTGVYKEYQSKYQTKKTMGTLIFYLAEADKKEFFQKFVPINKGGKLITPEMRTHIEICSNSSIADLFYILKKDDVKIVILDDKKKSMYVIIWNQRRLLWEYNVIDDVASMIHIACNDIIKNYLLSIDDEIKKMDCNQPEYAKIIKYKKNIFNSQIKTETWSNCIAAARFFCRKQELRDYTFLEKLDKDVYSLPIRNGNIVNLITGEIRKRTREDLFPEELHISSGDAENENVIKFFMGLANQNKDVYNYIQEICGYSLSGTQEGKSIFLIHGPAHTGKSEIVKLLSKILGRYYYASNNLLNIGKKIISTEAEPELASLAGKRVVVKLETSQFQKLNTDLLKKISGGDDITARMLKKNPITSDSTAKVFIVGNFIPDFDLSDDALVSRLKYIEFENVFERSRENIEFVQNIYKNHLDDVFAWMLQGAVRYFKNRKFTIPEICIKKQNKEMKTKDDFGLWVEQTLEPDEKTKKIKATELFDKYQNDVGMLICSVETNKAFIARLRQCGYKARMDGGSTYFFGIKYKIIKRST